MLISVQRVATRSSLFIILRSLYMFQVSNTPIIRSTQKCNYSLRYWSYFLCSYLPPKHPSSRVHKTVTTVSDTGHIFCAATSLQTPIIRSTQNCNYSLRYRSYFLCSYLPPKHPSSGVHKTVTTASGTVQLPPSNVGGR